VVPTGNVLYYINTNHKDILTNDEESDYAKPGSEYDECGAYRQCMTYVPMMKKVTMPSQVVAEVIFDPVAGSHVYD